MRLRLETVLWLADEGQFVCSAITVPEQERVGPPSEAADVRQGWPPRPASFGELLRRVEAAQYLRLDETGLHTPSSAIRTLNYWRDRGQLRATKYARHVWYRRTELDAFLARKTEA